MAGRMGGLMPFKKRSGKENVKTLSKLYSYIKGYKLFLIGAVVLTILSNIGNLVAPKLIENSVAIIESGLASENLHDLLNFCILMIAFYVITYFLSIILSYTMIKFGQNVGSILRKSAFQKFDKLPVSYFDTHQTGDVISRFTYDIDMVAGSIGGTFVNFATSTITLVGSFVMMLSLNFTLMTSFFITIPISLILGGVWAKKVRAYNKEKSVKIGELNWYVEDKISGHKTIKVYSQEKNIIAKFLKKNEDWGVAQYNAEFKGAGILKGGLQFVTQLTTAFLYIHGVVLLINGEITLAEITAFVLYAKMFTGIVNELSIILADLQIALATADRVFDFIEEPEEKQDKEDAIVLENPKGDVSVKEVSFGYDKHREILKEVNIEAKSNKVIAIVGHTGAGKTTLINLLMKFYHTSSGGIYFDGVNIEDLTKKSLRSSCTMVLQDTWLFSGTIYENIAYGKENATRKDVEKVAKAVSLHNYIMSLPNGYDTVINEGSMNISAGQKQLITIARAMLLDAKILILDEATSNVDTLTEINVQKSMSELMKNKTSFVIAHRLSTIKNADTILMFENGQIIESGTHEELLSLNKNYAKLYYSQFDVVA